MSRQAVNAFEAPAVERKLTAAEVADIKHRDITAFVTLNVVTLGFYWLYVIYHWAKEINGLSGRVKYPPALVLLVSLLTCGMAGLVFECLFAFEVAEAGRKSRITGRNEQLGAWVIACNAIAMLTALIPFVGLLVALPLGILASSLVQVELNRLRPRSKRTSCPGGGPEFAGCSESPESTRCLR